MEGEKGNGATRLASHELESRGTRGIKLKYSFLDSAKSLNANVVRVTSHMLVTAISLCFILRSILSLIYKPNAFFVHRVEVICLLLSSSSLSLAHTLILVHCHYKVLHLVFPRVSVVVADMDYLVLVSSAFALTQIHHSNRPARSDPKPKSRE